MPNPELQTWDFSKFAFVGEGFRQTELYVDFQRSVQEVAKAAAGMIEGAPPFSPDSYSLAAS